MKQESTSQQGLRLKKGLLEDYKGLVPDMVRFSCLENLLCQVELFLPLFDGPSETQVGGGTCLLWTRKAEVHQKPGCPAKHVDGSP